LLGGSFLQRKALTVGKVRIMTLIYSWQQPYKAALSETQPGKMQEAITKAEHAIQQRLAEKRAIGDILAALAVLKTEIV
jgi:hypothetical protein